MSTRVTRRGVPERPVDRLAESVSTPSGVGGRTDVTACDREPIHIPGSIQPHGGMLVLDRDLVIRRASANIAEFVGIDPERLIDEPLRRALGSEGHDLVTAALERSPGGRVGPLVRDLAGLADASVVVRACDLTLSRTDAPDSSGGSILLEIEEDLPARALAPNDIPSALLRLQATPDLAALMQQTVDEVAHLTGFDRVMMYRFNAEGDGEVVAERASSGTDSYLGLHYPGSDIPRQARELYRRQWLRLIVSSDYAPSPLLPVQQPGDPAPLDLSQAALRSVSPVHLQYLRNMGVAASMSMSVVVEDQLWGLILCHGRRRHLVPSALRTACEQVAQFVSLQVESRGATARLAVDLRAHQLRTLLVDQMTEPDPVLGLAAACDAGGPDLADTDVDLLDVLEADAAAARLRGRTVVCGDLVDAETADRLVAALRERAEVDDASGYVTSSLRRDVPAVADLLGSGSDVAGVLLAPRPDGAEGDYLVWFRREVEHTVNWAGEPTVKDQSGALSPRASFALWREKVRDHGEPWQTRDVELAARLADAVDARLHRLEEMALAAAASRAQELFQREHEIADALQRGMLPVLPEVDGLTLSAAYVTVSDSADVGGDWYDVFTLPDGTTGIAMGDVTGHDLSAAAVMGQLRSILRSYAWEQSGPDQVLDKVDALVSGFAMQKLATVFFARLERPSEGDGDERDGALLRYANAGHLPPVLRLPDGRVELLEDGRSVLIGVAADLGHEAATQLVPAGSTLVLYTDGLVERRDREISDGIDELRSAVAAGPADADALRDHVLSSMVPGRRDDDVAVLVVCVH